MRFIFRILGYLKLFSFSIVKYCFYNINPSISIGKRVIIERNVSFNTIYKGSIKIGHHCELRNGVQLLPYSGKISIGNYSSVNPYTIIYGQGNTTIGNYVRIAAHCTIIPSNHKFSDTEIPICEQGLINKGIIIEDDVWIGTGVRILDGVKIAKGCIIGAGSVVTHSTDPYSIYVGVPAKKIKSRT